MDIKLATICLLITGVLPVANSHADHVGIKITTRPTVSLVVGRVNSATGAVDPVLDAPVVSFNPTVAEVIDYANSEILSSDTLLVEVGFRKATQDALMRVSLSYSVDNPNGLTGPAFTIPWSNISWKTQTATGKSHLGTLNNLVIPSPISGLGGDLAYYESTINPAVWFGGELTFSYKADAIYPEGTYNGNLTFKATVGIP